MEKGNATANGVILTCKQFLHIILKNQIRQKNLRVYRVVYIVTATERDFSLRKKLQPQLTIGKLCDHHDSLYYTVQNVQLEQQT
jgi:hypothetical protein